jgi:hypothetical protein
MLVTFERAGTWRTQISGDAQLLSMSSSVVVGIASDSASSIAFQKRKWSPCGVEVESEVLLSLVYLQYL